MAAHKHRNRAQTHTHAPVIESPNIAYNAWFKNSTDMCAAN